MPIIWLKRMVKIGPVDPEIIDARAVFKNKEINVSKSYSPPVKFAGLNDN